MTLEKLTSVHRPFKIDDLSAEPMTATIDASAADREELAKSYDVQEIRVLKGDMDVTRHGESIRVAGHIDAELGRTCVVSLEPMSETISEDFAVSFTTAVPDLEEGEVEADLDAPEPLEGEFIDLGDVLLEQLTLAMSAHPRKEGVEPPEDPGAGAEVSPFAVLKDLKTD